MGRSAVFTRIEATGDRYACWTTLVHNERDWPARKEKVKTQGLTPVAALNDCRLARRWRKPIVKDRSRTMGHRIEPDRDGRIPSEILPLTMWGNT